jgi:hypothetical protein
MAQGRPFITVLTDGLNREQLTLFSTDYFLLLMLMVSLTGPRLRWMAVISGTQVRRRCKNKHSDIAGDNGLGRSRGGFGTKIHLATDGSGLPLNIILSPGQAHESQLAQRLLDGIGIQHQNGSMKRHGHAVLADKVLRTYIT